MKRKVYEELLAWKQSSHRKPLLIQGARQVGKTYIVTEFGHNEYSDIVYLDFEQDPDLKTLFAKSLTPQKIITDVGLYLGRKIVPAETLFFFDEIQAAPRVLVSLKYFCDQAPEYHVIAAGSLLGVSIGKESGFPVGKVNFLTIYPMSFFEYLTAFGESLLAETLCEKIDFEPLAGIVHEKLLEHLKMYLYLGGMPEVLKNYLVEQDIGTARKIQNEILEAFQRDFSKYTVKSQAIRISELWHSIPGQLARERKKFKYSEVRKNARSADYEQVIEWLRKAGLIHVVNNIKVPKLPLSGYGDLTKFKIYLHDTGLLGAMLNITSDLIIKPNELFTEYNGAFIENYIASELVSAGFRELYYWTSKSEAEVDFVLQRGNSILPVEAKSGLSRNLKSLRSYENKYKPDRIFRCSPRNFLQNDNFINLPLYASWFLAK